MDRVELEKVSRSDGVGVGIVDLNQVEPVVTGDHPRRQTADASEAIDADPGH
jgi:hypothetical protein